MKKVYVQICMYENDKTGYMSGEETEEMGIISEKEDLCFCLYYFCYVFKLLILK